MALLETSAPTRPAASAPILAGETQARRVVWIDGLRGLAVLIVLLYHHWGFAGYHEFNVGPLNIPDLLEHGVHGVHIFFVVSGFCLAWPFSGPEGKSLAALSLGAFLKQRFHRLARPYYLVLALSALPVLVAAYVKTGLIPDRLWLDLLAHGLFVHNLSVEYVSSFNMALWTLALQFQFYLLFPLFLWLRVRLGPMGLLLLVGAGQLGYRLAVWSMPSGDGHLDHTIAHAPPGRMFEFVTGIVVASLVRAHTIELSSARTRWMCLLIALGTAVGAYGLSSQFNRLHPAVDLLWAICIGAAVCLGFGAGPWRRLLEQPLLIFCGVCSYSIFLVHHPIGVWLHHHFYFAEHLPLWLRQAVMLAYLPLMIGTGWLVYRWLERPAGRIARAANGSVCTSANDLISRPQNGPPLRL